MSPEPLPLLMCKLKAASVKSANDLFVTVNVAFDKAQLEAAGQDPSSAAFHARVAKAIANVPGLSGVTVSSKCRDATY